MKWIKKIKKVNFTAFIQGAILLIVAILLTTVFTVLSFIGTLIWNLITIKLQTTVNQFGAYMKKMALSIDQFGNVSCAGSLRFLLVKKEGGHAFGDPDDTVSYVLGRNKYKGKLKFLGKIIVWILHLIERNHVEKAIENKMECDRVAQDRLKENKYYE